MRYNYLKETPRWMIFLLLVVSLFAIVPILNMIVIGYQNLTISFSPRLDLTQLGQFGDFFGGHTSAFAGSLSLVVVLFFTFHQSKQQRVFFLSQQADTLRTTDRQFFLEGINLITQWDIKAPGCDQCMRLLDYYGRLALLSEDRELLLLLNTVITAKIRENLEGKNGSFKVTNYPYACEAIKKIRPLREANARAQKASKSKKVST
ncbi:hypothetical protein I5532_13705 [Citrobacter freundii]|uniref:hypothetical protein n=1 Tax=Citrobacter freundii TaxID=546 RepID=UPI00190369C3|nr:hypothetical protein [Citrobacter freundii]MBJ9633688.1 hypothetical protein [Citrobacter freundii]